MSRADCQRVLLRELLQFLIRAFASYQAGARCFTEGNPALDSRDRIDERLIEVQGTAEKDPFTIPELNKLVNLAKKGIGDILAKEKKILPAKL